MGTVSTARIWGILLIGMSLSLGACSTRYHIPVQARGCVIDCGVERSECYGTCEQLPEQPIALLTGVARNQCLNDCTDTHEKCIRACPGVAKH